MPKSKWVTFRDAVEDEVQKVVTFIEGTTLGQQLEADVKAALIELETVTEADLKTAVTAIGTAILGGLETGGTAGAIAAGIAAAPAAFAAIAKDVSHKTTTTLVSSIVNSLSTPAPAAASTGTTGSAA